MRRIAIRRWLGAILLLAGSAMLLWCVFVWSGAAVFERWEAHVWSSRSRTAPVPPDSPAPPQTEAPPVPEPQAPPQPQLPQLHDVIAWMEIPRLGLRTAVLEGDDTVSLSYGAGHIPGTPEPWVPGGNVGIAAHRDTIFRALRKVKPQDRIHLQTLHGDHDYVVESTQIVKPSNVSVLAGSAQSELTLVTCYPFYYIGSAPLRFVVRSREVD